MRNTQRSKRTTTCRIFLMTALWCQIATSQEKDFKAYPENVATYLKRI